MACYHPIPAYQEGRGKPVTLYPSYARGLKGGQTILRENLALPCGKCLGCRTDHATRWANRCTHEASISRHNIFLTLTYADENLPNDAHLRSEHLQLFIKRLRKRAGKRKSDIQTDRSRNIRYFACGEYGEQTWRPHYHLLVFNCRPLAAERVGKDTWASDALHDLWPDGSHQWGEATPGRAGNYIAKYSLKQLSNQIVMGDWREPNQGYVDKKTGEWRPRRGILDPSGAWRPAPFLRMSLRPAIGKEWLERYYGDLQHGYIINNGRKQPLPRYYKQQLKEAHAITHETLEYYQAQLQQGDRNDTQRLKAAEQIHVAKRRLTERRGL